MADKFIKNELPLRELPGPLSELLKETLEELLETFPVRDSYQNDVQKGIFSGYTSLAFLLLRLGTLHPRLAIKDHNLQFWAEEYLKPACTKLMLQQNYAGLHSEKLSVDLIRACLSEEEEDSKEFLPNIPAFLGPYEGDDPCETELFYGRSGVLYMLRVLKAMVPSSADAVEPLIKALTETILSTYHSEGWKFAGKRYLGPAHGDIGTITQLVLSRPSMAPKLTHQLQQLLELQLLDGNWPATYADPGTDEDRVQFCHGAPGFIVCLRTLRPFFPELHDRIDAAITKGSEVVWDRGLLRKEPSICHGIFGNALALPRGERQQHFLAHATSSAVEQARRTDPSIFESACYTAEISPFLTYLPSAAWTWAVCEMESPPILAFNDV